MADRWSHGTPRRKRVCPTLSLPKRKKRVLVSNHSGDRDCVKNQINFIERLSSSSAYDVDLSSRSYFYIVQGRMVMNLTRPFRRRDSLVISIAILKAARHSTKKTHLLNSVSMSYGQFTRYVELLEAQGFIRECESSYQTTKEGLDLINEFESSSLIRSILPT